MNLQQGTCTYYISDRTLFTSLHYLAKLLLRTRSTFRELLMMFMAMFKLGETNLIFVDPGVKINGTYCRDVLLTEQLLPDTDEISGELFLFQQDSAPTHRVCETMKLLVWQTLTFISPNLRLPIVKIWTQLTTEFGRNAIAAVPVSSWRWWIEAVHAVFRMAWSKT